MDFNLTKVENITREQLSNITAEMFSKFTTLAMAEEHKYRNISSNTN